MRLLFAGVKVPLAVNKETKALGGVGVHTSKDQSKRNPPGLLTESFHFPFNGQLTCHAASKKTHLYIMYTPC